MEKEKYLDSKYNELEEMLKETKKKIGNNAFYGTLLTSLFAIPAVLLSGSGLAILPVLYSMSVLIPTVFIGSTIREKNTQKFINDREKGLDKLLDGEVKINRFKGYDKIDEMEEELKNNNINTMSYKFLSRYVDILCGIFAFLAALIPTIAGFAYVAFGTLLLSIVTELANISYDREDKILAAKIDNLKDKIETSIIEYNQKLFKPIKEKNNSVGEKGKKKSIDPKSKAIDEYVDSLHDDAIDISKQLIKR